jgi:CheY-like chemotaxis protein
MRIRVLTRPINSTDGVPPIDFHIGDIYELSDQVAALALCEGWGELARNASAGAIVAPRRNAQRELRVLVVEDDPDVRRLTQSLLTAHGYRVRVACDGRDALAQAHEECPDLIVLDLNMPVMDGWQFRTAQRYFAEKKLAEVPVLLMTGADDAEINAEALRVVGIIKKPFDPEHLLDAVSAAVG